MTLLTIFKKNSLALRLIVPILILMIILGIIFSLAIFSLFHQFAHDQIEVRKHHFESDILELVDVSYSQMLESGEDVSSGSVFLQKARTTSLIEVYCTQHKLHGKISENGKLLYQIENKYQDINGSMTGHVLISRIASFLHHPIDYGSHVVFKPWKWKVSFYQNDAPYQEVMGKASRVFIGTIILFIVASLLLMVIFNRIVSRPLREIIEPLRDGEMPAYKGINEFEFLSNTICRDITGRLQVEDELINQKILLEHIFDAVEHPFYLINARDHTVLMANKKARENEMEFDGTPCYKIIAGKAAPCDNDSNPCPLELMRKSGKPVKVEHVYHDGEGKKQYIQVHAYPLTDKDGKFIKMVEYLEDITERKQNQKLLVKAKEDALAASKAKSEFLATMSHEIRTPMNAIIGFTDMALATDLTGEQQEFIQAVNHAGATLLDLINDILDFSKIEAGKLEVEHVEVNLPTLIDRVVTINQGRAKEKGLELQQIVPQLDRFLISDPARIQQILTNLIGNAVKFTSTGRITVEVQIVEQTADTITLEFAVSDTGIGIPEKAQEAIFDAFSQADGSVTRKFGGTGLGLSISNQLVALLGGTTLKVSSQEGEGSTFSFELPCTLGGKVGAEPDDAKKVERAPEKISACRILLVEDNLVNVKLATRLIEKQGHRVTVAENGRLGVDAAFKDEFDLILMDMMMPEMDGLTATREIRRREKESGPGKRHLPIVAMTANAMKGDREKCIEAGMDDYLTKPIKIDIINQVIDQCLANRKNNGRVAVPAQAEPGKTVLVVDDNLVNCKLLSAGLKREGYEVLIVHDGQQAVDTYQQEKIDAILMDIQMPVMDGLEATRQIRGLEADRDQGRIPIIAVTAHANREEWLEAGMDMGFKKPVKIADLVIDIENLLKA